MTAQTVLPAQENLLFTGTYTRPEPHVSGVAEGVFVCRLHDDGRLSRLDAVSGIVNPSFLAPAHVQPMVYAVSEVAGAGDVSGGAVVTYRLDGAGRLTLVNRQPTQGKGPCHLAVDDSDRWLVVATYGSGTAELFPLADDGAVGPASHVVQHRGAGPNPTRQSGPHAHSVTLTPDGRLALVADLGLDKIMIYRIDRERGRLEPNAQASLAVAPGAGPRHLAFHPAGRFVYVANELDSTVTVCAYATEGRTLTALQTVSTLPADFAGDNTCADIHVLASGRFVYASNRGHDSIAVFAVDPTTGQLHAGGYHATQGRTPRNFTITPEDRFLLAANQDSHTVVTFAIDSQSGQLSATGAVLDIPSPVCLRIRTGV